MRNEKKHLRSLFYSLVLFLFCFQAAQAQPTCSANFDPNETCEWEIQSAEFIFLGRVVAAEKRSPDSYAEPTKAIVEVETSVKGNLAARRIELFINRHCYGEIYENRRYIFTAERIDNEKISGLFSKKWSSALTDDYSANDVKKILDEIRAVAKGVKRPRLAGSVVEQDTNNTGRYLLASGAVKKLLSSGGLRPMPNVVVTAKRKDGGQEFKTATDADGSFVFDELPKGVYELFTNLPKEFDVMTSGISRFREEDNPSVEIGDYICGNRVIFNAQLQGDIKLRFDNASSRWSHIIVHLWRVFELKDGKTTLNEFFYDAAKDKFPATENSGDIGYNYHFKKVPAGQYVLMLSVTVDPSKPNHTIYYPGTFIEEKAFVINVEAGKTSNIEFSLPDLPEN
jgi:hypothetical protein